MAKGLSKGLGKGFDVLIPANFDENILIGDGERVQKLSIKAIQPNPDQPRKTFDKDTLQELAGSIKQYGILQPLIVSPAGEGYVIVAGERRWRAAQIAGLTEVPAIVRKREELEQLEVALIENVQRVDLSPLEQAVSIERLHQQFNVSYQAIADRLSKALPTIHNIVRLLQLPEEARDALQKTEISEGHGRAILSLKGNEPAQQELLQLILKHHWSVRQAEQFASSAKQGSVAKKAAKATVSETPETKQLGSILKTKVTVKRLAKGGRLEIHYKDDQEFAELVARLNKD